MADRNDLAKPAFVFANFNLSEAPAPWHRVRVVLWSEYLNYIQSKIECFEFIASLANKRLVKIEAQILDDHLKRSAAGLDMLQYWQFKVFAVTKAIFEELISVDPRWEAAKKALCLDGNELELPEDRILAEAKGAESLFQRLRGWICDNHNFRNDRG